jgi:hypothetical protein
VTRKGANRVALDGRELAEGMVNGIELEESWISWLGVGHW